MWSIAFVAVAKSLIPLNLSVPAVASQLSHSAATQELPHGQCIGLWDCGHQHLTCCPLQGFWQGPGILHVQPEAGMSQRRREEERDAAQPLHGRGCRCWCAQEAAGRGLSPTGAAGRRAEGFTGPSHHTSSPGVTSCIQSCLPSEGGPQSTSSSPRWRAGLGDERGLEVIDSPSKDCAALGDFFSFQQSMEMCLSENRVWPGQVF